MVERASRTKIRLADPAPRLVTPFDLRPDATTLAALAEALGITAIRKLAFTGKLTPVGRRDWALDGTLGATVVQPCVLTLAPVTTRIDEAVTRRYVTDLPDPAPGETEFTDDESEALPPVLIPFPGQHLEQRDALALHDAGHLVVGVAQFAVRADAV